jgi:N-acetylglucosaminyldiphosphoundecaprenol N-acetyl-beta-D-mannosaminyltransferase
MTDSSPVALEARRRCLCGVPVDDLTMDEAVSLVLDRAERRGPPSYVVTPNAQHVLLHSDDKGFARIYEGAWLSLPDGKSLLWAGRVLGIHLRQRVTGIDLLQCLCEAAVGRDVGIFLLGGRPRAAEAAAAVLVKRHPGLRIAGIHCPPYGFETSQAARAEALAAVRAAEPQLLFVGLGAPKQERWIADHVDALGIPVAIGVGVSFEFVAGMVPRAPKWMGDAGLEWLFRMISEPRRLWRRYLVGNVRFVALVARQLWGGAPELRDRHVA